MLRCVLFKQRRAAASATAATPANGMRALLRGRLSVYAARGDLQLIVAYLEDAGEGALRRAFDELKRKLADEGLFAAAHKQALPAYPATVGVICSASGAALHDLRVTLARRYPAARLVVYPTAVQGAGAVSGIVDALAVANRRRDAEVLIVTRGGGSPEDLQAFNDEAVARAIFASELPVISAVGHEIDFTIADLVADFRAATPTAAAETVAPDIAQLRENLHQKTAALQKTARQIIETKIQKLDYATARLTHPLQRIQAATQTQTALTHRLATATKTALINANQTTKNLTQKLKLMSPKHTLARGYAIIQNKNQEVISECEKDSERGNINSGNGEGETFGGGGKGASVIFDGDGYPTGYPIGDGNLRRQPPPLAVILERHCPSTQSVATGNRFGNLSP